MENKSIENEIIVIGAEHYNALGVIRSLGESGLKPYFILVDNNKISPSASSKYIKKVFKITTENYDDVLNILRDNFNNLEKKPIIIPTGDPVEKFLDLNYDELSKKYILPNIDGKQGAIVKCMDKYFQYELCKKYNVNVPKTWLVDLNNIDEIIDEFPEKIIIKPYISADGEKSDILVLSGLENTKRGITQFKEKGYKTAIVQEFIEYDTECSMMGISCKEKVIIPGIYSKIFMCKNKIGNSSYSKMSSVENLVENVNNIIDMVKSLKFTGLFEIEIFKKENKIYFNEMNFRNSANQYAYLGNNIPYIYIYLNIILGNEITSIKQKVDKEYYFCIEPEHLKNVKEGLLTYKEWWKHVKNSTTLIYNKADKKPFFKRIQNSIYLRITNKL
jgi:predicted ATP-grasp superfamily ATP-dependent carboligase